ncbi:MAG: dicarboxylate/amino acid:cation symporter [Holosporales bacterium]|jgi:proton glutamate symport protein|nr:dicarboxylate/amino acid:cation symporter [Holosporales bacterium]
MDEAVTKTKTGSSKGIITIFVLLISVMAGITFPELEKYTKPASDIFLTLIFIPVIPIIFASVTCTITKMLTDKENGVKILRTIITFILALICAGIVGCLICAITNPGDALSKSSEISNMIFQDMQKSMLTLSFTDNISSSENFPFLDFITALLPKNPFAAFAHGNIIQILSLSILCGIAIATLDKKKQESAVKTLDVMMIAFNKILNIPIKILPLGLFFTITSSISTINVNVLMSMQQFCISAILSFIALIVIAVLLVLIYSPVKATVAFAELKDPVVIAFSTCSNQATIPFLISTLVDGFKLDRNAVNIEIPLGVTMCRAGNVAYYAFITVFIAMLYNEPLSIPQYLFIVAGAILVSFSATGVSGIIAVGMVSMVLDPLNLPIESVLALLVIIDPVLDPFRTVTSLIVNAALACFVINKSSPEKKKCT